MKETFSITKNKIVIFIIIIAILFVSNAGLWYYNRQISNQYYRMHVDEDINALTLESSKIINIGISNAENQVNALSKTPVLHDRSLNHDEKIKYFEIKAKELGFEKFFFTNYIGDYIELNKGEKKSKVSSREFFKEGLKGRIYTSKIKRNEQTGVYEIIIAAPLYVDNKIVGVFGGVKNANFLKEACRDFTWGKTGTISIFDNDANLIVSSNENYSDLNLGQAVQVDSKYLSLSNFFNTKVLNELVGNGQFTIDDVEKYAGFYNMKSRGLIVLISIDKTDLDFDFTAYADNFNTAIICSFVFSFILIFMLVATYIGSIYKKASLNGNCSILDSKKDEKGDINTNTENISINDIIEKLKEASNKIIDIYDDFNENKPSTDKFSGEIARNLNDITESISSQVEKSEKIINTLDNIGKFVDSNKESINIMTDDAQEIEKLYKQITGKIGELVKLFNQDKDISESIKKEIDSIKNESYEIKSAGEMLKSLSEQIQLLSLNAAIDAAKDDNFSKEFVSVSDEIKNLSEKSLEFSKKLTDVSDDFITCIYDLSKNLRTASEIAESQTQKSTDLDNLYKDIYNCVDELTSSTNELLLSNSEINRCKVQLSREVKKLESYSRESNFTSQETCDLIENHISSLSKITNVADGLVDVSDDIDNEIDKLNKFN